MSQGHPSLEPGTATYLAIDTEKTVLNIVYLIPGGIMMYWYLLSTDTATLQSGIVQIYICDRII
jgi:hypothetical protein